MTRSRYEPLGSERRGYPMAVIRDLGTSAVLRIYRKGSRWLLWPSDRPVRDLALIRAARTVLEAMAQEREASLDLYPPLHRTVSGHVKRARAE